VGSQIHWPVSSKMNKELQYKLTLKDFFSNKLKDAAGKTKVLDGNVGKLKNSLSGLKSAVAGIAIGGAIVGFGKQVIESLKNYEYFSASLRTLMYGDVQMARSLEGQLVSLAATTPFSLREVQDGSKQLLAYGFEAGNVTSTMRMLGDVAAGVGSGLNDVAYLYGTLRTQGIAYTRDINQFTNRGIPILKELAKVLGVTENKVKGLVEEGKVGFKEVEKAFKNMTSAGGQFFNLMEAQSKTVGGRLSNFGDTWEQLRVNIGKSQTGIIASTVSWAEKMLSKLTDVVANMNKMDEAFVASGKNLQYSVMDRFNNWLFMGSTNKTINKLFTGGKGQMDMLQRSLEGMYVNPSQRSEADALQSKKKLAQFASNYISEYLLDRKVGRLGGNRRIADVDYERTMALIKQAQGTIDGNLRLFKTKGSNAEAVDGSGSTSKTLDSKVGSATEVYGNRPQNITINLERLGDVNIEATNITESAEAAKEVFSKKLLEVLNDANLIAK
jgi:tape measure domain-containing protein